MAHTPQECSPEPLPCVREDEDEYEDGQDPARASLSSAMDDWHFDRRLSLVRGGGDPEAATAADYSRNSLHALVDKVASSVSTSYSGSDCSASRRRKSSIDVQWPWCRRLEPMLSDEAPTEASHTETSKATGRKVQEEKVASSKVEGLAPASAAHKRSDYHLTSRGAAVELFYRLNHARQTLDFVQRQATEFGELEHAELSIWEALQLMNELREYEANLQNGDADLSLLEHACQTAELCRLAFPGQDWLHLVGLIHGLGKLLAHERFGTQPQWAVCGETFPVGCRFSSSLRFPQFFSINPDRRKRGLNSALGIYTPQCGLRNIFMAWGGCEYLYLVMALNQVALPLEALFIIRFYKFRSLLGSEGNYRELLSSEDEDMIPLLKRFMEISEYKRKTMPNGILSGQEFFDYYNMLIEKYIGLEKLYW